MLCGRGSLNLIFAILSQRVVSERAASPPHQNLYEGQYNGFLPATTAYKMGRRLPDKVVHRIRIRLEAGKEAPAIAKAVGVGKKTIYKLRLNLDIWGKLYAPTTVVLGRP